LRRAARGVRDVRGVGVRVKPKPSTTKDTKEHEGRLGEKLGLFLCAGPGFCSAREMSLFAFCKLLILG
jgi:hypothetical protein